MKPTQHYRDTGMWKGAKPETFAKAKELRKNMTLAEKKLWELLKEKKWKGYKFRRQHPIAHYIADFYCHKLGWIIEIDGRYHNEEQQKLKDLERTDDLKFQGLKIFRFTNEEIMNKIKEVMEELENQL